VISFIFISLDSYFFWREKLREKSIHL